MSNGPWEKYATQVNGNGGPWEKYAGASSMPSPGVLDTAGDAAKSVGSGVLRGVGELADIPVSTWNLGQYGINAVRKFAGYSPMEDHTGDASYFRKGMENLTGGASEYKPTTTLGKYAGTVGEFIPGAIGAALTGGESLVPAIGKGILTSIIPGAASEAAGEATAGTKWEPIARAGAAILGGKLSTNAEAALRPEAAIQSAGSALGDIRANHLKVLQDNGMSLPAGLKTNSLEVQAIEGSTGKGASLYGSLNQQYTGKTMRDYLWSDIPAVSSQSMTQAHSRILGVMKDKLDNITLIPDPAVSQNLSHALSNAASLSSNITEVVPKRIKSFSDIMEKHALEQTPMDTGAVLTLRTDLGKIVSGDDKLSVRRAASAALDAIDDMIDGHYMSIGALSDLQQLRNSRQAYRNYLAVEQVAPEAINNGGVLDPKEVAKALKNQGLRGYVQNTALDASGNPVVNNPFAEFTQAASSIFSNAPKVYAAPSGVNSLNRIGNSALGMSLGQQLDPLSLAMIHGGMYGAGKAERAALDALHRFYAGKTGQRVLTNLHTPNTLTQLTGKAPLVSGLNSAFQDRTQRKSGGRVSTHDAAADQLVRAAERAKKGQSAQTEALLQQPDNAVAHALEVANRSI